VPGDDDPLAEVLADEEVRELRAALTTLTPPQRELVIQRIYMGLSSKEAAEQLGSSESAVTSMLSRVYTRLRKHLGTTGNDNDSRKEAGA
jgi:RNA polymerase sigma factor (sigma-70 family)